MKILYVINSLGEGGAERSLAEMLPLLPGKGVEPMLVCLFRRAAGVEDMVVQSGVPICFLESRSWAGWVRDVRRIVKQERPDVVHTTIFEADIVGRVASVGTPVVGSLVNTSYGPERRCDPAVSALKLDAVRLLDGFTARHMVKRFHALTDTVKEHAVQALGVPPERIVVVPRGRDATRLGLPSPARRAAARHRLGLPQDAEVVLNVGRQEYQKDHTTLISAFAQLAARRPRALLIQAGREGASSPAVKLLVKNTRLGERVRLLGHRDDVPDLLAAADVFAFPSLFEGLGGAVLEAMALGLPVVATDLPVLREVVSVDRSALVVPPRDPAALAAAVERVLDDPILAARLGDEGRRLFLVRHGLEATTGELVTALYGSLA